MMLQVGVNCKKEDSSFHQADLTEIQVINKNIKRLNRSTIYRTFKAINQSKGIQRRPGSGRNSSISKSTFEIIKKCLEIDNGLSAFELSNKIFAEKGVKISSVFRKSYSPPPEGGFNFWEKLKKFWKSIPCHPNIKEI